MRFWFAGLTLFLVACSGAQQENGPHLEIILADAPADKLSDYGLFLDASGREPAERVIAYDLVNPLFSDYSDKHRHVFIPAGETAEFHESGAFSFPVGSVISKTFSYDGDLIETRLLVHKADGWHAYPYVWNDADTEAVYAPIGASKVIETTTPSGAPISIDYAVPNKNQCKTCHGLNDAVFPIGPKARNLGHQIHAWSDAALLSGVPSEFSIVPHTQDSDAPLSSRARAYLEINCAHCHREGGSASNSGLWLEWNEDSQRRLGIQKRPTAAGRATSDLLSVIDPGKPDRSIMVHRMASLEAGIAMPELGRSIVHDEGVEIVKAWIAEMEAVTD